MEISDDNVNNQDPADVNNQNKIQTPDDVNNQNKMQTPNVEVVAPYKNSIDSKRAELQPKDVINIWTRLSDKQIETLFLQEYIFDIDFIKGLQNDTRYPVPNPDIWKAGKNFEGAVYIGTRKDTNQTVYIKQDGWFTTPEDITNCLPIVTDDKGNVAKDENGYIFLDATAKRTKEVVKGIANKVNEFEKNIKGGKTRKTRKYRKTRKSRKSKRRCRK